MSSIEQAQSDVDAAVSAILALAHSDERRSLFGFERELWARLLTLGRVVVALFFARTVARPRPVEYTHAGKHYILGDERTTIVGTLFGKVEFTRRVGRRKWARKVVADLPVDRELGLCGGFSLTVVAGMARLCAQMPFATAREMWRGVFQWAPSSRATLRMVDGVGKHAREFLEQADPPEGDGEILVVQMDGGGAPRIREKEYERRRRPKRRKGPGSKRGQRKMQRQRTHRPRRTKGMKSKNAKVAFVGVLYTLKKTDDGLEGPVNKQLIGTFESHRALFMWLRAEADKRGYGSKRTVFIADGSAHIWRLQQEYFPDAECCLDWYHLVEYLWKAGHCVHREGSKAVGAWVAEQKARLRAGEVAGVLAELGRRLKAIPKTGPGNKGRRERLAQVSAYIDEHQSRLPYEKFLADGLDIGSGAVEGAIRNLVRMRLDGPGMRWGAERSELVLHLRCILLNRQWDAFVEHLGRVERLTLPAQPQPATPYDAKAAA